MIEWWLAQPRAFRRKALAVVIVLLSLPCTVLVDWFVRQAGEPPFNDLSEHLVFSGVPNPSNQIIYWIDEDTLFFSGLVNEVVRDAIYTGGEYRLHIWKIGRKPEPYATTLWPPNNSLGGYCASQGAVYYPATDNPGPNGTEDFAMVGPPNGEKKIPLNRYYRPAFDAGFAQGRGTYRWECDLLFDERLAKDFWYSDSAAQNYLSLGDPRTRVGVEFNSGVTHYDAKTLTPTRYDQVPRQAGCVTHFVGVDQFLIWDCSTIAPSKLEQWRQIECWPYWLISSDGKNIVENCVPYDVSGASLRLFETKVGTVGFLHKVDKRGGLYRFMRGEATLLIRGFITHLAVSPSGCRVAFNYLPSLLSEVPATSTLRTPVVLDLCEALGTVHS